MKKNSLFKEKVYALFFSFEQSTKVFFTQQGMCANLNPFYLIGLYNIFKNKNNYKLYKYFLPILIYCFFQILFLPHVNIVRMLINVFKIILCISIMDYVKNNYNKINIKKVVIYSSIFLFAVTLIALIFRDNGILWRINDFFNKYDKNRLQGLFLEPSELGFHAMVLMIFLLYFMFNDSDSKKRKKYFILFLINAISLYFAKPMGAIVIGFFSISLMMFVNFLKSEKTKKNMFVFYLIILLGVILLFTMIKTENAIWQRILDTFNGTDPSNNYRVGVSLKVLKQSFIDYFGMGLGFGNLNTPFFSDKYAYLGLSQVVANSFQYFVIEGGIFSVLFLIILCFNLIRTSLKTKSSLRYGLLSFLFLYQIFGSHFTNGIIWFLYGLCLSEYEGEKE